MTLERTRYFSGQRLSAEDLAQDQDYFRAKARRHNLAFHGWGVVWGLDVGKGAGVSEVVIAPGLAIDPRGEEIALEDEVTVDLAQAASSGCLYVAVGYAECLERPVPALSGSSDDAVEHSRVRETFAVEVLDEPPGEPWVILAEVVLDPDGGVVAVDGSRRRFIE